MCSRGSARSRTAVVLLLFACAWLPTAAPTHASPIRATSCGTWRWPVKTLSDPDRKKVHFSPRGTRVQSLRRRTPPSDLGSSTPRTTKVEFHTWELKARPVQARIEGDGDIHLVIAPPHHRHRTMIVEFPKRSCVASPFKRHRIATARRRFVHNCGSVSSSSWTYLKGSVDIVGVGFWDAVHDVTEAAPNGIELHPVLGFSGSCSERISSSLSVHLETAQRATTRFAA
jgi:hypothetical protein